MKRIYINIIFILLSSVCFSQTNLVPNPSFEDTVHCPISSGEIANAEFWFSPLTPLSSSDYFNSCSPSANVPNSPLGFQQAHTGNAFAGIILYAHISSNYREYIETKLTSLLIQNKKYCIEFYVNLANASKFALDKIGLLISNDSIINDSLTTINKIPQIENLVGNIISDTVNWVKISGEFIAQGGEQFITIGNFYSYSSTNIDTIGYPIAVDSYAYYYIDDVSVYYCDTIYKAEAGKNKTICEGDSVQIGLPPNTDCYYKWQPVTTLSNDSIANPWVKPAVTTVYYLQQTFMSNKTTDSVKVTVINCEDTLKNSLTIPNAFTPNGDGANDYFKVKGNNIRTINGKIFNRWGQLLYNCSDINKPWDGKYNNKYVSDGVYFYIINVVFEDGETQEKHGCIEIVK